MTDVTREIVLKALEGVVDPESKKNVVAAGLVGGLAVHGTLVRLILEVPPERGAAAEPVRTACEAAIRAIAGVSGATVVLTAHSRTEAPRSPHAHPEQRRTPAQSGIDGVAAIIAVASGKGGVGKSTLSVNLALALAAQGLKVGLLDADIYGPSVPKLLGLAAPEQGERDGKLLPAEKFGLKVMSIGFMIDEDTPMIWRGPMVQNALTQMLREIAWAPLDVLVIDMPPGTGDAQLTLVQSVPLKGAVIVSTPQDLALIDARKALNMFRTTKVPVLGVVENMSVFVCPHCGAESHIFGKDGAKATAERLHVPFLGSVPLVGRIREASDAGSPVVAAAPDSPEARAFHLIAAEVAAKMNQDTRPPPKILVE
jgi:ATP-binding protein involved in chromosome partitioning